MEPEGGGNAAVAEVSLDLATMSETQRAEFLKTGELPQTSADGETTVKTGAASDAAGTEEHVEEPKPGKSRFQRAIDRKEARIKQLEAEVTGLRSTTAPIRGNESASAPATAATSKTPKLKSFTDQIGTKFTDWETAHDAYEDAVDAFHVEQRKNAVTEALKTERERLSQQDAQTAAQKTTEAHAKEFAKRADVFRKTLKEDNFQDAFSDVYEAVSEVMAERPEMGKIADKLVALEAGPQLVHYFGQNPDDFDALLELSVDDALFELGKLAVSDKIKAPQPKTITATKRIRTNVAGAHAETDPELAAVEANDMGAFLKAVKSPGRW